jgi:hypothetical protein
LAERYGTRTREDTGGKATSAVPDGPTGTSSVADGEPGAGGFCVLNTSAGACITAIVGGVSDGTRPLSDRDNPYDTSPAATKTPTVTPTKVLRDRDRPFGSILSSTGVSSITSTLAR